jgi:hypothetical protein
MSFEKRGIPAVAVITEPFVQTADAMARLAGMPGYAVAVLPHPFGSLGEAEVAAHAERILPRIETLLLATEPAVPPEPANQRAAYDLR